ncbi:MAG TPA: hypothetical protein VFZ43_05635, partial [Anaerolineales bacterium]
ALLRQHFETAFHNPISDCHSGKLHSRAPRTDADEARDTLFSFLMLLNTGKYDEAVSLYGGEYEALQVFNPEIEPEDHVALWAWACENQLLQCLQVRSATLQHQEGDTYVFQVEFSNPDGSLFILGPCCGADETEMPPVSQFEYKVARTAEGRFVVMELPPYVP